MDPAIEPRILDLVDWLIEQERTYEEVVSAWRRCGHRLRLWGEAKRSGMVTIESVKGRCLVKATSLGLILGELRREARRQVRQPRPKASSVDPMGV